MELAELEDDQREDLADCVQDQLEDFTPTPKTLSVPWLCLIKSSW